MIGAYRFSDDFIKTVTTVFCVSMVGMIGGGYLLGYLSDNFEGETRNIFSILGLSVVITGITLPLLIAGILGGEAIMRGAGALGFWIVGWIAEMPIWIQGPELGSPRAYVRGPGDNRFRHSPNA